MLVLCQPHTQYILFYLQTRKFYIPRQIYFGSTQLEVYPAAVLPLCVPGPGAARGWYRTASMTHTASVFSGYTVTRTRRAKRA